MKPLLFLALAARLIAADATGTWTGTITNPGPAIVPAYLILKQEGTALSGSGGPDAKEQHPIENGKVVNGSVTFDIPTPDALMKFVMNLDADAMTGELTREQGADIQKSPIAVKRESLLDTISALDTALFASYNACDLKAFATFFPEDIEFYHDKGGLTNTRKALVESVQNNICGKTRRELVAGTLEVYPVPGYGAIEVGSHRFFVREKGGPERLAGTAKFLHIWRKQNDEWKVTRVVSYDH